MRWVQGPVSVLPHSNMSTLPSAQCNLQQQSRLLPALPTPRLPSPGCSSGCSGLSDLGRPGAAVSLQQQQDASKLPSGTEVHQWTATYLNAIQGLSEFDQSTFSGSVTHHMMWRSGSCQRGHECSKKDRNLQGFHLFSFSLCCLHNFPEMYKNRIQCL